MDSAGKKSPLMLSDIRVLDFTQYLAGPTVTRLMAEMGADIIKVEQAPGGDPSRLLPMVKNGRSAYFVQQNRGKKSLCLDFARPESIDLLRSLVEKVDVVVENYGPGVLEKKGLDYASLKKINPRVIMASISAFGRSGPLSHRVGYDFIAQAFSGLMHMTGAPEGPPMFVGMGIADQGSGVHAFSAIGYALYFREKTGIGQHIDISMVDALFHMHEVNIQAYTLSEGQFVPARMGSHHALICPCGVFKGPRGWIVILVLDRQWPAMARAMGRPDLIDDPRFATGVDRGKNQKELIGIIEAWMQSFLSDDAVLKILEEHRVPSAPVITVADSLNEPYFKARDMIRKVADPVLGELTIPGFPLKFSEFPELPSIEAPLLGQHGPEVLRRILGLSDARIAELRAAGVLHSENK
ncbi:MAG TPA: CoA transferase [Candidatus Binataceae bacterium]|nr:CoA transferase [Candidatus Binataceae bacterium]